MKVRLQSKVILWLLFYFEKESEKRMKTFKTEIKNVFQQGLKKYGFVKVKGSQPYFVRFVNNEILHVITFYSDFTSRQYSKYYKAFAVVFGVATVYRKHIELDESPKYSGEWLNGLSIIYEKEDIAGLGADDIPFRFQYEDSDEENMMCVIKKAFDLTEKYAVPILDEISTLEDCVKYFFKYKSNLLRIVLDDDYIQMRTRDIHNEGLLCTIVYGNERYEEYVMARTEEFNGYNNDELERIMNGKSKFSIEQHMKNNKDRLNRRDVFISAYKMLVNDAIWKEKVCEELKIRKISNIALLKKYRIETIGGNINET